MESGDIFKQACDVVKQAVDADSARDFKKALTLYEKALTYFIHVIRCACSETGVARAGEA